MVVAVGAGHHIDMANFMVAGVATNIVTTGEIGLVLARSAALGNALNVQAEMEELMNCLSQTLSMEGQFKGKCASGLKFRFMQLAKLNPLLAEVILKGMPYRYDVNFSSLIEEVGKTVAKANYLERNGISRFFHHLSEKDSAANVKLGLQILLVNGIFQTFMSESNARAQQISIATAVSGGGLIATSFFQAIYKAYHKKF